MMTASTPVVSSASASYSCRICSTTYTRLDHLRRHRTTHHEQKTVTCEFCNAQYFRQDILRRHYSTCKSRNDRPLPLFKKRGRRIKACDRCALYKSACNHEHPCSACIDSSSICTFERLHASEQLTQPTATIVPSGTTPHLIMQPEVRPAEVQRPEIQQPAVQEIIVATSPPTSIGNEVAGAVSQAPVDLGSIESIPVPFLLDYTSSEHRSMQSVFGFSCTPSEDLPGLADLSAVISEMDSASDNTNGYNGSDINGELAQQGNHGEQDFPSDIHDLLNLQSWNSLSPDGSLSLSQVCIPGGGTFEDAMGSQFMLNTGVSSAPIQWQDMTGLDGRPAMVKRGQALLDGLSLELMGLCISLQQAHPSGGALLEAERIQQFFTTSNLQSALSAYFHHYHPHCPILHPYSFNPHTVSPKLLLALFFAGTVFSSSQENLKLVHDHLHLAGKLVLGSVAFREMTASNLRETPEAQREYVEILQAAVILSTLENNEGSIEGQNRIRTITYPKIALCARNLKLLSARNSYFDSDPPTDAGAFDWDQFLLNELRLRLMQVICWMDFEFSIFHGVPAQFLLEEINTQVPCADEVFCAPTRVTCWEKLCSKRITAPPTLRFMMKALVSDTWDSSSTELIANLNTHSLFTVISAIIELKWASRGNFLDTVINKHVEVAVSRWRMAWDLHQKRLLPQQARRLGFVKHALEMWWLANVILSVVKQEEDGGATVSAPGITQSPHGKLRDVQNVIKAFGHY